MMTRYLVIGAGGHAQEVAWSLDEQTRAGGRRCEFIFFDDRVPPGPLPSGLGDLAGTLDAVGSYARGADSRLVLGIGLPRTKSAVVSRLGQLGLPWATVIHPGATIGPGVSIGCGSYIGAGAVITVKVRIGQFVTVNFHCQVAHDDVLGDFVTLHPDVHLSGNVRIGDGAELGTGAIVIPGTTIGPWAVLGAGAVAVRSLAGERTYVGLPAHELVRESRRTG